MERPNGRSEWQCQCIENYRSGFSTRNNEGVRFTFASNAATRSLYNGGWFTDETATNEIHAVYSKFTRVFACMKAYVLIL